MKTTVELDNARLKRVMHLTGLATKTAALDYALRAVERLEEKKRLYAAPATAGELAGAIDPNYDLKAMREGEKPARSRRR